MHGEKEINKLANADTYLDDAKAELYILLWKKFINSTYPSGKPQRFFPFIEINRSCLNCSLSLSLSLSVMMMMMMMMMIIYYFQALMAMRFCNTVCKISVEKLVMPV
jgi:hypothetical protein